GGRGGASPPGPTTGENLDAIGPAGGNGGDAGFWALVGQTIPGDQDPFNDGPRVCLIPIVVAAGGGGAGGDPDIASAPAGAGGSGQGTHASGGGGGGSPYIDPSVLKVSETATALGADMAPGTPTLTPVYDTSTTLSSTLNPSVQGDDVTLSAHVSTVNPDAQV